MLERTLREMESLSDGILLGAVAYDAKVVPIWEGMRAYFHDAGVPLDFALFSNYERQVEALLAGHIDIAWNTPLAHVRVYKRTSGTRVSLGMRDSDRDFHAKIVVRNDAHICSLADLHDVTLAMESRDSTQARILPLHFLRQAGVDVSRCVPLAFDTDLGKHGDTGSSELDGLAALHDGRAQAGCLGDLCWINEQAAGRVDHSTVEVLWTTPAFDHCMFDALPTLPAAQATACQQALMAMQWDNPAHRKILEPRRPRSSARSDRC